MNIAEIRITVPWGHIAGKSWGNEGDPIVLMFHGLMDNAGSFDRLIPLLPKCFNYIALDLPGHGRSSHFPSFVPAYSLNNVIAYKLIAQHFGQEKYTIIGHSYGGQITITFAIIYPEFVEKIVLLDTVHFYPISPSLYRDTLREKLDHCISLPNKTRPSYSFEKTLEKLQKQRFTGIISKEAALALHPRAIEEVGDGQYSFTLDPRLRSMINPINNFNYIVKVLKKFPITCPILMISATDSNLQRVYFKDVLKVFRSWKNVRMKVVHGSHDVHNNNPEVVEPYISRFLLMRTAHL